MKRILRSVSKHRGEYLQWISASMVLIGVFCEYRFKADLYFVLITTGALFWGVAQKLKHPTQRSG